MKQNSHDDYKKVVKCLTIDPQGFSCVKEDKQFLEYLLDNFICRIEQPLKRPDAYAVNGKELLLLEHFQFDNSKVTSKGSKQLSLDAEMDRYLSTELQKSKNNTAFCSSYIDKSGVFYCDNFIKQFNNHYAKINEYKIAMQNELNTNFDRIYVGFVIEDASSLGSCYYDKTIYGPNYLNLLNTKEFLDIFEKSTDLDFVFFAMSGNPDNSLSSFISRNTINIFRKNQINAMDISEFAFRHSISFTATIPVNNDENKN